MIESAVAIKSDRFGQLTVDSGAFFKFDAPLPGFEKSRNYVLLKFEEFQPFAWLQSTEESHVCLPLVDPWRYFPEYQPRVSAQTIASACCHLLWWLCPPRFVGPLTRHCDCAITWLDQGMLQS